MAAEKRGDFRLAAVIYAKLLNSYRDAANALLRGGLHFDAAIVFLDRVDDPVAAAQAFESAGHFDRALTLYRRNYEHMRAARLLRRLGDEASALKCYILEAERLALANPGSLAAGDLLLNEAHRPDLAMAHYQKGWDERGTAADALSCLNRLIAMHLNEMGKAKVRAWLGEAEDHLEGLHSSSSSLSFYKTIVGFASDCVPEELSLELRDRALLGASGVFRKAIQSRANPLKQVSEFFGSEEQWPAELASDALHAVKLEWSRLERSSKPSLAVPTGVRALRRYRIGYVGVTAVAFAEAAGIVFMGHSSGAVYGFDPKESRVISIAGPSESRVRWLATDSRARHLAVLTTGQNSRGLVRAYGARPDGSYLCDRALDCETFQRPLIAPVWTTESMSCVGLWDGKVLKILMTSPLAVAARIDSGGGVELPTVATPAAFFGDPEHEGGVFVQEEDSWWWVGPDGRRVEIQGLSWKPSIGEDSPLESPIVSTRAPTPYHFEIAGLAEEGRLFWTMVSREKDTFQVVDQARDWGKRTYRACTLVSIGGVPGLVGVANEQIDWLDPRGGRMQAIRATRAYIHNQIACFHARSTNELIIVCKDGFIARCDVPD